MLNRGQSETVHGMSARSSSVGPAAHATCRARLVSASRRASGIGPASDRAHNRGSGLLVSFAWTVGPVCQVSIRRVGRRQPGKVKMQRGRPFDPASMPGVKIFDNVGKLCQPIRLALCFGLPVVSFHNLPLKSTFTACRRRFSSGVFSHACMDNARRMACSSHFARLPTIASA